MLRLVNFLMDSANDNGSASGYEPNSSTPSTPTDTTPQGAGDDGKPPETTPATPTTPQDQTGQAGDQSKPDAAADENVTGYDTSEKPKEDDKGGAKDTAVKDDKPLELDLKSLKEEDVKDILDFAKTHGLSKEQAQGLVDQRKTEADAIAAHAESQTKIRNETYKAWETELRNDGDFGGENFKNSVHAVNKLIREEIPELKNILTESGKRLPPSIMKNLKNLATKLYGETPFNEGEVPGSKGEQWKSTDFYNKTTNK